MKKAIALLVGGIVVMAFLMSSIIKDVKSEYSEATEKYKAKVGERFVIEKDTLLITDYSMINGTFTLSDGRKVNEKLIFDN